MNIKDFLPPVLIGLAKKVIGLEDSKIYKSYFHALQVCSSDAYENAELCNMIADKTVIYKSALKEKPYILDSTHAFLLSALNQYLHTASKKRLTVLDFGGACGAHYFEVRRFIPKNISVTWYVVETPQMVKSAVDRKLNSDELVFVDSLKTIKTKVDFIHTSGALQYVEDPYTVTKLLTKFKADRIFVNRMMFNELEQDFVTVQKSFMSSNGPGKIPHGYSDRIISYPHTTMAFKRFNSTISKNGYTAAWMFLESSGSHQIKNARISGKGLLYVRK